MECENRKWMLVAFLSKSLNETERNYKIHNKEMLAVIRELKNWKHLLKSSGLRSEQIIRIWSTS